MDKETYIESLSQIEGTDRYRFIDRDETDLKTSRQIECSSAVKFSIKFLLPLGGAFQFFR